MLTTIPFSGFYDSLHSSAVEQAEEQMFSDRATGFHPNPGLQNALFRICDYHKVYQAYAQDYTERFAIEFKIPSLKFESLNSPREYNFVTDRIFAEISLEDVLRLKVEVPPLTLVSLAKASFTHRDGFSSFYSPDIDDWGPIEGWDHNQVGTLLAAYVDDFAGGLEGFDQWAEYDLMSDAFCNGALDTWIQQASPGIERLYKVHDYLEQRAERSAQAA